MSDEKIAELLENPNIIRNRLKIKASVTIAQAFIKIQDEFRSFNSYIWQFTDGKIIYDKFKNHSEIASTSDLSDKMSKDLKARGLKFVGSTICYDFMQVSGIVNDHTVDCFRYQEIQKISFN